MNNITDFFRDPRLDNFDDPQGGTPQLDDAMDPPPPAQGKPPNKMLRIFSGNLTASTNIRFPDNITSLLKVKPEGWIVRMSQNSNTAGAGVTIVRQGGDDIGPIKLQPGAGLGLEGPEKVVKLPGPSDWLELRNGTGGAVNYLVYAYTGYNPLDLI